MRRLAGFLGDRNKPFGGLSRTLLAFILSLLKTPEKPMNTQVVSPFKAKKRLFLVRATLFFVRHWLILFLTLFGIYNLLPFAAPVAMRQGWIPIGSAIYDVYATQCHQMAQRSFFLFGAQPMYNLNELPLTLTGKSLPDMLTLRAFRGDDILGWKVAWSDRMVYMYGSLWIISAVYWVLSRRHTWKPLRIWIAALLLVPMAVDGITHLLSDGNGLSAGFRYDNMWLAALTNHAFADSFYRGDTLGSFNSLMRFATGVLFAFAAGGITLPFVDQGMRRSEFALTAKLNAYDRKVKSIPHVITNVSGIHQDRRLNNG